MDARAKLCLLYTGGTIGMRREADGALRPRHDPESFLSIAPEVHRIATIGTDDFVLLMNKDSSNMAPADWATIATAIHERRDRGYAGFVVLHGTDTMHFAASAVAFALGRNLNFPVVFTGAQAIPDVPHGDARVNLLRACQAATSDLAEVAICFGDFLFRGCRTQKKDSRRFDAYTSPALPPLGEITERIVLNPHAVRRRAPATAGAIDFQPWFADGILQVFLSPGLEPELYRPAVESERCRGLILQTFGAGNIPSAGPFAWTGLIERAVALGKPVALTSQFPADSTRHSHYETGLAAIRAGAFATGNLTAACAVAKFRWVIAQVDRRIAAGLVPAGDRLQHIAEWMQRNLIGESDD